MKKYIVLLVSIFVIATVGIAGVAISSANGAQQYFASSGYVLGDTTSDKISFTEQTAYSASATGTVRFQSTDGTTAKLSDDTFVHLSDGSVMALSDGILLDFADLSSNFINNYYTTTGLVIAESGTSYVAETESGTMTFGENLWKLSDSKYIIRSSNLTVNFSTSENYQVNDYVEVSITADGIVQILSETNTWMTISESCYIETAGGVIINPITKVIDNGTYQITLNNLVVSPDDSIVLTEDETRRQIVPELKIETIDGEDGIAGESGEAGESGVNGTSGESGTDGEEGGSGDSGGSGSSGSSGSNGSKGVDAAVESSTNTALATMTISDWNVTSTSLQATIAVGGGVETLDVPDTCISTITITNVATGEVITCYETDDETYSILADTTGAIDFTTMVDVYFTTADVSGEDADMSGFSTNTLAPDTEYVLSVNAYYQVNDTVYKREFISRTFYTDSTGVQFAYVDATTSSVTIDYSAETASGKAKFYLLTQAQNESFSIASTSYTQVSNEQNFASSTTGTVTFSGLDADTEYIVRMVVTDSDGNATLSSQEEIATTLKRAISYSLSDKPTAYYNRVNGAIEVYRPSVTDPDSGMQYYMYTAYDSNGTAVATKTVYLGEPEPIVFYLASGDSYTFNVEAYFNDNEKTSVYDLGTSATLVVEGSTLPNIQWSQLTQNYNAIDGTICLTLDGSSAIDTTKPIYLNVYADQIYEVTIELKTSGASGKVSVTDRYSVYYEYSGETQNTNYLSIYVDFDSLFMNTNYTFTVTGSIDFDGADIGNEATECTLGYISARTYSTDGQSSLSYTNIAEDDESFKYRMSVNLATVMSTDASTGTMAATSSEASYVYDELKEGALTINLYEGTSPSSWKLIGTATFTADTNPSISDFLNVVGDSGEMTSSGVEITEDTFANVNLTAGRSYTLEIEDIVDGTWNDGLGYENTFVVGATSNANLIYFTPSESPPDLSTTPNEEVTTEPIYNIEASDYGAVYNTALPDDAIIGYRVQSLYSNELRLAQSITYYVFEYADFYNKAQGIGVYTNQAGDPITDAEDMMKTITIDGLSATDEMPALAIFFDDVTFTSSGAIDGTYAQGCYLYQGMEDSGEDVFARGYCYLFACKLTYLSAASDAEGTATVKTYPNDLSTYTTYKNSYGCGVEGTNKVTIGDGVAYILNSGLVYAPKTEPTFYSYLYDDNGSQVTIHYTYIDGDEVITADTDITGYDENDNLLKTEKVTTGNVSDTDGTADTGTWYDFSMPYNTANNGLRLSSYVSYDPYEETIYSSIFSTLNSSSTQMETICVAQTPLDSVGALSEEQVIVTMQENYELNYITFTLSAANGLNDATFAALKEQLYGMKLTFSDPDADASDAIASTEVYMPISYGTDGSPMVTISTGAIQAFLGEEFEVSAELYYDDGTQGWSLAEAVDNPEEDLTKAEQEMYGMFALQRANSINTYSGVETFALSTYLGFGSYTTVSPANDALIKASNGQMDLSTLRNTVFSDDTLTSTGFTSVFTSTTLRRYLFLETYGMANSNAGTFDGLYIVPKGVASYTLYFPVGGALAETQTSTLASITPAVVSVGTQSSAELLRITGFQIDGYSQIKETTVEYQYYASTTDDEGNVTYDENTTKGSSTAQHVTICLYDADPTDNPAAEPLHTAIVQLSINTSINVATLGTVISIDGTQPTTSGVAAGLLFTGLTSDTEYWYEFSALVTDESNSGSSMTILRDGDDASAYAIYSKRTTTGVTITNASVGYTNLSYLNKYITAYFTLNETLGIELLYDIYASEDVNNGDTLKEGATPVLAQANMITNNPDITTSMELVVNLEPGDTRASIVPGATYYLYVRASTDFDDETAKVATSLMPFTIPSVGNVTALISVTNAASNSISYTVSVIDEQNTLMGSSSNTGAYVVRFTDQNGKQIYTTYDDEVYDKANILQPFVLDATAIAGQGNANDFEIMPNTKYTLTVYAVLDQTHNGYSYPIATVTDETTSVVTLDQSTVHNLAYFSGTDGDDWKKFITLVDSFWDTDGNSEVSLVEDNFSVNRKTQSTTDTSGVSISDSGISASYNAQYKQLQVVLTGSYGLTYYDANNVETQTFARVEYYVTGGTSSTVVSEYDEVATSEVGFTSGASVLGAVTYTYIIPLDGLSSSGSYDIELRMYENADDSVATATITASYN